MPIGFLTPIKMNQSCEKVASTTDMKKTTCGAPNPVDVSIKFKHFRQMLYFYSIGNILALLVFLMEKLSDVMTRTLKRFYYLVN